jgi:hypothetical protein
MLFLYVAILAVSPVRDFYELRVLSVAGYILIAHVVFGWALGLRLIWRADVPGRAGKFWRWLTA